MSYTENIVIGKKYRILTDNEDRIWDRISFWTDSSDVNNFIDTDNVEATAVASRAYKVGEIIQYPVNGLSTLARVKTAIAHGEAISGSNVAPVVISETLGATNFWIGPFSLASGISTYVISDTRITANSAIDVYYSQTDRTTASDSEPNYEVANGSITITFVAPLAAAVTIAFVHVTNL